MSKERLFQLAAKADEQLHQFYTTAEEEQQRQASPLRKTAQTAAVAGAGAGSVLAYQNREALGALAKRKYAAAKPGIDSAVAQGKVLAGKFGQQAQGAAATYGPQAKAAAIKYGGQAGTLAKDTARKGLKLAGTALGKTGAAKGGFIRKTAAELLKAGRSFTVADVERVISLATRIEAVHEFAGGYVNTDEGAVKQRGVKAHLKRNAGKYIGIPGAVLGVGAGAYVDHLRKKSNVKDTEGEDKQPWLRKKGSKPENNKTTAGC